MELIYTHPRHNNCMHPTPFTKSLMIVEWGRG